MRGNRGPGQLAETPRQPTLLQDIQVYSGFDNSAIIARYAIAPALFPLNAVGRPFAGSAPLELRAW